jgi:hypothetical protein
LKDIKVYNPLRTKTFRGSIKSMDIKENIPEIWPDSSGLNLKVNNLKQDSLEILISTDDEFRSENHNLISLFIQTHGIINHLSAEKITEEITKII